DYERMMGIVEALVLNAADSVREALVGFPELAARVPHIATPFRRVHWVEAVNTAAGADVMAMDLDTLRNRVRALGVEAVDQMNRPKLLDELFQELVESKLDTPTFVMDYPRELSPLAKPRRGNPLLTERFELFAAGKELANAFSELNDPLDQRSRLEAQAALRDAGGEEAAGGGEDYLRAMERGRAPTGGGGESRER